MQLSPENLWIQANARCWYFTNSYDSDPFSACTIQKLGPTITLKGPNSEIMANINPSFISQRSEKIESVEDMVDIECLNDAELLNNLKKRFLEDGSIFTYVGPTLLIVNPYRYIDALFNIDTMALYQKQVNISTFTLKDLPPHIFAIAAELFKNLFEFKHNQALVISGESGAGKTENTKYAMKFLTSLGNIAESKDATAKDMFKSTTLKKRLSIKKEAIEDKILSCNPILEAFGNSKTVRNDNSSRFGKYVTLLLNQDTRKIMGARIYNYLLEKSRIPNPAKDERNYHIFYHLLKSDDPENLIAVGLKGKKPKDFNYLNMSGCEEVKTVDDESLYIEVSQSFKTMGFSRDEEQSIWNMVSAILYIGNIDFDDSKLSDTNPCIIKNKENLEQVSKLLGIESIQLESSLVLKTREVAKQIINSPTSKIDCGFARDSLSKDLYNKLFCWLVFRLNENILPIQDLDPSLNKKEVENSRYSIGLLDIFGFECFKFNSFEQLCINFTNEKLQQLYISYVFKAEENEFIKEGLKDYLCELNFVDNQGIIDLLEQYPAGIFNLLDESCAVAGDDDKLLNKIRQTHKGNVNFIVPKLAKDCFTVIHTAKEVEYNIFGFREKNKDEISKSLATTMENSKYQVINTLYSISFEIQDTQGKKSNQKFLSGKFRNQMKSLMNELESCDCHFIRCLKPNDQKKQNFWMGGLILQQIKYLGVMASIKVRRESYPVRRIYKPFYERFGELADEKESFEMLSHRNADFKILIEKMMKKCFPNLGKEVILFGKTKLFMRTTALNIIEKAYKEKIKIKEEKAIRIQRAYFRYKQMNKLRNLFKSMKRMQNLWKVRSEHKKFKKIQLNIRIIQRWWKKKLNKLKNSSLRKYVMIIQTYIRRFIDYKKSSKKLIIPKIIKIQKFFKRTISKLKDIRYLYIKDKFTMDIFELFWKLIMEKNIIKIQKNIKGKLTRKKEKVKISIIKERKDLFIKNKAAIKIQKVYKQHLVRENFLHLKLSINKIKGFFKTKWYTKVFKDLKWATLKIQRTVRPFLLHKKEINLRMKEFLENEEIQFNSRKLYESTILYDNVDSPNSKTKEVLSEIKNLWKQNQNKESFIKEISPYDSKNIDLPIFVFDIDLMTDISIIYPKPWSQTFQNIYFSQRNYDNDIQYIQQGLAHSILTSNTGKIFTWGWNDKFQQGVLKSPFDETISSLNSNFPIKQINCGDDHTFIYDEEGNLFFFGKNEGKWFNLSRTVRCPTQVFIEDTIKIDICEEINSNILNYEFSKKKISYETKNSDENIEYKDIKPESDYYKIDSEIKQIFSKGKNSYILTEKGETLFFKSNINIPLYLNFNTIVTNISCSFHFTLFLTKQGYIYSMGNENSDGELGLGDKNPRSNPTLIESIKSERIISIECGFKHVIAKSASNNIWVWGSNKKGQLGKKDIKCEIKPVQLDIKSFDSHGKPVQIQTGFSCSIILFENGKMIWWGTNNSLQKQDFPLEVDLFNMSNGIGKDFQIVRILSTWSRNISIIYCTLADMRNSKVKENLKCKIIETLQKKWAESNINSINPPFIDSISNYFSGKYMKVSTKEDKDKNKIKKAKNKKKKNIETENNEGDYEYCEIYQFLEDFSPDQKNDEKQEISEFIEKNEINEFINIKLDENHNKIEMNSIDEDSKTNKFHNIHEYESKDETKIKENIIDIKIENKQIPDKIEKNEIKTENEPILNKNNEKSNENKIQIPDGFDMEKLREIKKKLMLIFQTPKEQWNANDVSFIKVISESKIKDLLSQINI